MLHFVGTAKALESLNSFITLVLALWYLVAFVFAVVIIVGLFRRKRGRFFFISCTILSIYLLLVGANFYKYGELRSWVREGDEDRAALRGGEFWDFDPREISSIHLDWPLKQRLGQLELTCPGTNSNCGRAPMLAHPASGVQLEIGQDPVRNAQLLVGDPMCFTENPDLVSIVEWVPRDFAARGICMLATPVSEPTASLRYHFSTRKSHRIDDWHWMSEWRLETSGGQLIDRITTTSNLRAANEFLLPAKRDALSRSIVEFDDGPIVALRDWLAGKERSEKILDMFKHRREWEDEVRREVPLSDGFLIEALEIPSVSWEVLRLSCTQWDVAGLELRNATTQHLRAALSRSPTVEFLRVCGRSSCTPDPFGMEDPTQCKSAPPIVQIPPID